MRRRRPERPARCPRCGYDLRGVVDAWTAACPLEGVCTECGLRLEWPEILSAKVRKPRWCVEYAPRWWNVPRRAIRTYERTFWPWGFWRSLRMTHEPRWPRLAAYLGLVLLVLYGMLATSQALVAYDGAAGYNAYAAARPAVLPRPSPPWRTALYAGVFPLASRPGTVAWTSPHELFVRHHWDDLLEAHLLGLAFLALCPLGFVTLPVSRRQAKVRWAHIVRITLYTVPLALLPAGVWMLSDALLEQRPTACEVGGQALRALAITLDGLVAPFAVVWWSVATGRYLRMRHAWGVGSAVVAIALLLTLLGFAITVILATRSVTAVR